MAFPQQPGQPSGLPQTHTNVRQHSWTPQPPPWTPWTPQRQPHTWTPQRQPPPWTPQRHPHPWTPQPPPWITHHPTPHPHDQALNRPLDAALRKIHELEDALLHQATLSRHFLYSLKSPNAVICPDCKQDIAHTCSPSGFQPPMIQREHYSSSLSSNYPVGPQTPYANPFQFTEQTYPPSDFRPVIVPPPTNSFPFPPFPGTPGNPTGHIIPPTPRETRFGEGRTPSVRFRSPVSYISPLSPSSSNLSGVFIPPSPNPLPQQLPTSGPRLTNSSPSGALTPLVLNTSQQNEPIIQPVIPPLSTASPVPETSDSTDEDFISAQAREADWSITYTNDIRRPISSRRAIDVESVQSLRIGRESPIRSLKFSKDGKYLAVGYDNTGTTNIYDVKTGEKTRTLRDIIDGKDIHINSVRFSPNGLYIAIVGSDGIVRIWEISTKRIRNVFKFPSKSISCIDISPDGRLIALGTLFTSVFGLGSLHVWNWRGGSRQFSEKAVSHINDICFSPDGQNIAVGVDNGVLLWNVRRRQAARLLKQCDVDCIAFTPNGMGLVSGSRDGTVKLWNHGLPGLNGLSGGRNQMENNNNNNHNNSGGGGQDVLIFRHKVSVRFVAVLSNGRWIVSCSYDGVCVWNAQNAELHCEMRWHNNEFWLEGFDFSLVRDCLVGYSKMENQVMLRRIKDVLE